MCNFLVLVANVCAIDVISQKLDAMKQSNNAFQDRFLNFLEKAFLPTPPAQGQNQDGTNDNKK